MTTPTRLSRCTICLVALVTGLAGATVAIAQEKKAASPRPIRVLFVGNSQIRFNDLPRMVESLAESAPPDRPRVKADRAVSDGASLEHHWNRGVGKGTPRAKITEEKWDYVVIQEFSSYASPESFSKHARLFRDLIQQNGAQTVLLCTSNFPSPYPKGFQELHDLHVALGKELKVPVAAAGKAWMTYWGDSPTLEQRLDLFHKDKGHPGRKGSYIYACTLYAVLTGYSPVGLTGRIPKQQPEDSDPLAEAKQYQEAAWRVHQAINGKESSIRP